MLIIGCDLHTRYQQFAMLDEATGEIVKRRLEHDNGEAKGFYLGLLKPSRIGIEATGYTQWFDRLLAEPGHALWMGDAAEIRARAARRQELLELFDQLQPRLEELHAAVKAEAEGRSEVVELMKHKGVGAVLALAYMLTLGPVERFSNSHKVVSYLGLNPSENSSGGHQRLGSISKQGNSMMRWLLVEAGQSTAQFDPELRRKYQRLKCRRAGMTATVATPACPKLC